MKKQAKIIFYAVDQSTACVDERTGDNPFRDLVEEERKNGNHYGLGSWTYRKLLEENGYEWLEIHHNGDYGTNYVAKSENYEFSGWDAKHGIEIGDTTFWNGRIEKGKGGGNPPERTPEPRLRS